MLYGSKKCGKEFFRNKYKYNCYLLIYFYGNREYLNFRKSLMKPTKAASQLHRLFCLSFVFEILEFRKYCHFSFSLYLTKQDFHFSHAFRAYLAKAQGKVQLLFQENEQVINKSINKFHSLFSVLASIVNFAFAI